MSIKDCIKLVEALDPADAVVFEKHRKTLISGGVPGKDSYTQAAELTMEGILDERNELANEIVDKGGYLEVVTIEELLNPASFNVGEEPGVYSGYEIPEDAGKADLSVREDKEGQRDLFTKPGISGKAARAQSADTFNIVYEQKEVGTIQSSFDHIKNPGQAAHLFAGIRKHAQETMMAAVTDDKGKILNVIRHSIGGRDAAMVSPVDIVGAIAATEGGTQFWLAHNHPSGFEAPSNADKKITEVIIAATEGLGTVFQGHIVIAGLKYSDAITGVTLGKIPPGPRGKKIPITERRLKRKTDELYPMIATPEESRKFVAALESQSGILLMNNRHVPVGVIALTNPEMAKLKDGKQVRRILSALDKTNAAAVIVFNKTTYDPKAIINLTDYLSRVKGLRHLDTLVTERGVLGSLAEKGLTIGDPTASFLSRKGKPEEQTDLIEKTDEELAQQAIEDAKRDKGAIPDERPSESQAEDDLFADDGKLPPDLFGSRTDEITGPSVHSKATVEKWLKAPMRRIKGVNIEVVPDARSLRVRYPNKNVPDDAAGMFTRDKQGGRIFIIASNIRNKRAAHQVLAHELVGHLGLERMLGPERFEQLLSEIAHLKAESMLAPGSHPEVEEVMAFIKKAYVDEDGKYNLGTRAEAQEILAHIAENRPRIGAFAELYNKILNWIRNVLSNWGFINVTRVKVGRRTTLAG